MNTTLRTAISATLHCLTGCAIGEILGMIIGTAYGLSNIVTLAFSMTLAFLIGYTLSIRPLLKAGLNLSTAAPIILAADTLSITTMEITDTTVISLIPGAMDASLASGLFWGALAFSLIVAFIVAVPVNYWLLKRGKGHALVHEFHHGHGMHHKDEHAADHMKHVVTISHGGDHHEIH